MGILMNSTNNPIEPSLFNIGFSSLLETAKKVDDIKLDSTNKYLIETIVLIESITSDASSLKSTIMAKSTDFMKRLGVMDDDYKNIMDKYRQEFRTIKTSKEKFQLHMKLTMEISGLERIKRALDEYEDDVKFKNNDNYKKLSSKVNSMLQSFETLQNQTENKKVSG
jgi:hypothetical protein